MEKYAQVQIPATIKGNLSLEEQSAQQDAAAGSSTESTETQTDTSTSQTPDASSEPRPSWLPAKYKTAEDLAKAHAALEKKLGETKPAPKPKVEDPEKPKTPGTKEEATGDKPEGEEKETPEVDPELAEQLELTDQEFNTYSEEFAEKGELSAETYAALSKKGIPKAWVDHFIDGQKAIQKGGAIQAEQLVAEVGGTEKYNEMLQWAKESLPTEDIDAYNAIMDTGTAAQIRLAIKGMKAQHDALGLAPTKQLAGDQGGQPNSDTFEDWSEVTAAMKDPQYKTSEKFRRQVKEKIERSRTL